MDAHDRRSCFGRGADGRVHSGGTYAAILYSPQDGAESMEGNDHRTTDHGQGSRAASTDAASAAGGDI